MPGRIDFSSARYEIYLTDEEEAVLEGRRRGWPNWYIAATLSTPLHPDGVSTRTVDRIVQRLEQKKAA